LNKKNLYVVCILAFALGTLSCARRNERAPGKNGPAVTANRSPEETDQEQVDGPGKHHGRGTRGSGRSWAPSTSLRLTEGEQQAVAIESELVSFRPMSSSLQATGKIQAHQLRKAIVSYPFPARIARIHVRPGDWVNPSQPLVTLQSEAVGEAKAGYFKSLADYELARSNQEREKRLFDRGAGAGKNVHVAEAELKVAEASMNAAEKKLHILGFTEEQVRAAAASHEINPLITLFAPIPGTVIENNIVVGGMVDQSTEILTVLDPRFLCVDADIYERDVAKVHKGQRVDISVPAYPGLVFKGTLQYIGDILKEETRTITVRTEVANEGRRLKPGMFASLNIVLEEQVRALTVPASAVLDDGDDKIVFVRKGGEFFPRVVITNARVDGYFEVLNGVTEGEEVVTQGSYQLKSKLYDKILKAAGVH